MEYTQEQLENAFKKVRNREHWKNPIDTFIRIEEIPIVASAIHYFTATVANFTRVTTEEHGSPGYAEMVAS